MITVSRCEMSALYRNLKARVAHVVANVIRLVSSCHIMLYWPSQNLQQLRIATLLEVLLVPQPPTEK